MTKILKTNNSVPTVKEVQNAGVVPAVRELFRLVAQILDNPDGIIDSIKEIKQFLKDIEEPGGTVPSLKDLLDAKVNIVAESSAIYNSINNAATNTTSGSINLSSVNKDNSKSIGNAQIGLASSTTGKGNIYINSGNGANSSISVADFISISASNYVDINSRNGNQIKLNLANGNTPNNIFITAGGGDINLSTGGKITMANGGDMTLSPSGVFNVKNGTFRIDNLANIAFSAASLSCNGINLLLPITSLNNSLNGLSVNASVQTYYKLLNAINTGTIVLPQGPNNNPVAAIIVFRFTTSNSPSITFTKPLGASFNIKYFDNYVIEANTAYEVMAVWNNGEWIISSAVIF